MLDPPDLSDQGSDASFQPREVSIQLSQASIRLSKASIRFSEAGKALMQEDAENMEHSKIFMLRNLARASAYGLSAINRVLSGSISAT